MGRRILHKLPGGGASSCRERRLPSNRHLCESMRGFTEIEAVMLIHFVSPFLPARLWEIYFSSNLIYVYK